MNVWCGQNAWIVHWNAWNSKQNEPHLKHLCTTFPAPLYCSVLTQPHSTHLQVIHGILQYAILSVGVPLLLLHATHQPRQPWFCKGWEVGCEVGWEVGWEVGCEGEGWCEGGGVGYKLGRGSEGKNAGIIGKGGGGREWWCGDSSLW